MFNALTVVRYLFTHKGPVRVRVNNVVTVGMTNPLYYTEGRWLY